MNLEKIDKVVEIWDKGPMDVDHKNYHGWYNRLSSSFIKSMWDCEYQTLLKYVLDDPINIESLTDDEELKKKVPEWEAVGCFVEALVFTGEAKASEVSEEYKNNFYDQRSMYKMVNKVLTDTGIRKPNASHELAMTCYNAVKSQPAFMKYIEHPGSVFHEVIQFEIDGVPFKCEIDCLNTRLCFEFDFKTSADLNKREWNEKLKKKVGFIKAREYGTQRSIYQHAIYQKYGIRIIPLIGAVSKQKVPDVKLYEFRNQEALEALFEGVQESLPGIMSVLTGERLPTQCGVCDYCKRDKVISGVQIVQDEDY